MKRGAVVNLEATVESIKKSVAEAEAMAKLRSRTGVCRPCRASHPEFNSKGVTPIATRSREITGEDVKRVIETARAVALSPEREIIHIIPQEFTVDDQTGIADPIGMTGTRLEVNVHIVTSSTTAAQNDRDGRQSQRTARRGYRSRSDRGGEAVLSDDEKELGTVLVDIGGGKTSVAIYHHGAVRHTVVVPDRRRAFQQRYCGRACARPFPKPKG